jgi:hypothetical protein
MLPRMVQHVALISPTLVVLATDLPHIGHLFKMSSQEIF